MYKRPLNMQPSVMHACYTTMFKRQPSFTWFNGSWTYSVLCGDGLVSACVWVMCICVCVSLSASLHAYVCACVCVCVHVGIQMTILLFSVLGRSIRFRRFDQFSKFCLVFKRSIWFRAFFLTWRFRLCDCVFACVLCVCVCDLQLMKFNWC